jgi:hypothetical protein
VSKSGPIPASFNPTPVPAPAPLTPEQLQELSQAKQRWRKVQRAVRFARFSAWTMALIAAGALLVGIFDRTSAVMGLLLAGVTVNEFVGGSKLSRAQLSGPMLLGWNQLLLLGVIGGYCFYMIFLSTPGPLVSDPRVMEVLQDPLMRDQLEAQLGPGILDLFDKPDTAYTLFYTVVAAGSLLMQGLTALYYFSRRKVLMAYLNATPAWVVEVQRRAA